MLQLIVTPSTNVLPKSTTHSTNADKGLGSLYLEVASTNRCSRHYFTTRCFRTYHHSIAASSRWDCFRLHACSSSVGLLWLDVDRVPALVLVRDSEEGASRTCISLALCHQPCRYGYDSVCSPPSLNAPFHILLNILTWC
jgi:hypothetical protein